MFLSPKVLGIDTEPPQTVGLYVSQGLFPTKGVFAEWPDTVHDEEYNELKEPAAGLMLHLPMVKALRTTKGTWEIFFPCFLRLGTSGPKNGRSLLKSIDLRGIAKIRANNKGGKSDCFSPPHIAVSGGSWGGAWRKKILPLHHPIRRKLGRCRERLTTDQQKATPGGS